MTDPQEVEEMADAYVLGVMDDADRDAFEVEIERDPVMRRAVGEARDRFLDIDLAGRQSSLSPDLWARIEARLDAPSQDKAPRQSVGAGTSIPANDNRLLGWRRLALAATAASALFAAGLAYSLVNRPEAQLVAILMDDRGDPIVMIEGFGGQSAKVTPLIDFAVPQDRSLQVWTLPTKEMGPVSLGLLEGWKAATVEGPDLPQPREEQLYEITIEPLGGSPTGRPTGPILGKGFAKAPRI